MPVSSHSHSGEFCLHAEGTLTDVVEKAIERRFTHYGLSEHMPRNKVQHLYQEEVENKVSPQDLQVKFNSYMSKARELQRKYTKSINLVVGFETDVIEDSYLDFIQDIQSQNNFDYVVGSLHHVHGFAIDVNEDEFLKAVDYSGDANNYIDMYLDSQFDMIIKVRPDVIGHFDNMRIFCQDVNFSTSNLQKIRRNIKEIIDVDALVEINTSALCNDFLFPYPQPDILKMMIEMGVKFTISDDSHGPLAVGMFYDELKDYLQKMNINQLYYFEWEPSSCSAKRKQWDNPLSHDFWTAC